MNTLDCIELVFWFFVLIAVCVAVVCENKAMRLRDAEYKIELQKLSKLLKKPKT